MSRRDCDDLPIAAHAFAEEDSGIETVTTLARGLKASGTKRCGVDGTVIE
jgi:hypothetical protein